jgi:hypothetical protein
VSHAPRRVRGDPEDVDAAGGVLDDEERVEPVQGDGVEVEQVAGEHPVGLSSEELGPGGSGSAGRRVDASVVQDLPDGGGADLVAEAGEFAVDASVAPGGVLSCQPDDKSSEAGGDGWSSRARRLSGPAAAGDESPMPAQDRRGRDEQTAPPTGGKQPCQGGQYGSIGPADARPWSSPPENCELVAQDEDLDLLGGVGSAA